MSLLPRGALTKYKWKGLNTCKLAIFLSNIQNTQRPVFVLIIEYCVQTDERKEIGSILDKFENE